MNEFKPIYDLKNSQKNICCLCECVDPVHVTYWGCPIFKGEKICQECCYLDLLKDGVEKKFSEKLGRPISIEEINSACKACGKNYAKQNQRLADDIEQDKLGGARND